VSGKSRNKNAPPKSPNQVANRNNTPHPANDENSNQDELSPLGDESVRRRLIFQQSWEGVLPPPQVMEEYEKTFPGMADRLLSHIELEQSHRHKMQEKAMTIDENYIASQTKGFARGQYMAFSLTVCGIIATCICAYLQQTVVACTIISVNFFGITSAYIWGPQKNKSNDKKRDDAEDDM
jgi:uncharacterized membrane protein